MPQIEHATLARLTVEIARYLKPMSREIVPVYIELYLQFIFDHISNADLVDDFTVALDIALAAHGDPASVLSDIDAGAFRDADYMAGIVGGIVGSVYMQKWHGQYATKYFNRADWIGAVLEYVERVGPYLGRSLLGIRNPRYLQLIAMRLCTPGAFETTGRWPDQPPVGERRHGGAWRPDRTRPWQPVPVGVVRAQVVTDHILGCRLFPDQKGKDLLEIAKGLGLMLHNTKGSLVTQLARNVPSPEGRAGSLSQLSGTERRYPVPAVAIAFKLNEEQILAIDVHEGVAHNTLGWEQVELPQSVKGRVCHLIRMADRRAYQLADASETEHRMTGKRILSANVQLLTYAAILYDESRSPQPSGENDQLWTHWPFAVPDAPTGTFRRDLLHRRLIEHLGERNGEIGQDRLEIWCG